jgi:hypothetical protein
MDRRCAAFEWREVPPMIVKLVMMMNDESLLLEPWLRYHGYLFGFANLTVIDNGSSHPRVLALLVQFERVRVTVVRGRNTPRDFEAKGVAVGEIIRQLDQGAPYDYVFPIDCDEFIGLWQDGRLSCRRDEIFGHLAAVRSVKQCFRVGMYLFNIPDDPGWYWPQDAAKTFFSYRSFVAVDHGFHFGRSRLGTDVFLSNITYFHFHFKPYDDFLAGAKNKLRPFVDPEDRAALASYTGPGSHLLEGILGGPEAYLARFRDCFRIHVPEVGRLLTTLAAGHPMFDERKKSSVIPTLSIATTGDDQLRGSPPLVFDADVYLNLWLDVATAGYDPLLHYVQIGRFEGRVIA